MIQPLFDALGEIGGRVAASPQIFVCSDFDGTLSPIVDRPEDALLPGGMRRALAKLATTDRVALAIVGGRERGDVYARVGLPGITYAGNHGLEISGPGLFFVEPTAASQSPALHQLAGQLAAALQAVPGAFVEDKGLTLSVHCRLVEEARVEDVRHIVHGILATNDHPFRLTRSNNRFDVRPRVDWTKGSAVLWIKEHVASPGALNVYLGDGATDEEVFAALEDVTVKVGPPEGTAARYFVDSPAAVLTFLEWLTEQVR
jgi:trehalose-phosphatase